LSKEYKIGKREVALGTLLYLEMDSSLVESEHLKMEVPKYNFEILLRDRYPFQQPLIMTKTKVTICLTLSFAILLWLTVETFLSLSYQMIRMNGCLQ